MISTCDSASSELESSTVGSLAPAARLRIERRAKNLRDCDPHFARWAAGYGLIQHDALTQIRIDALADAPLGPGQCAMRSDVLDRLIAADRLTSAGLWLVAHMTYARRVRRDGTELDSSAFKPAPEGHTGGSLNMVPAYVGYLLANALSGHSRAWMMGQGHCVAAIDALNLSVGNLSPAHQARYDVSDEGLSRFVTDFYSYAQTSDGQPASPLGSHVNAHTAGGLIEGGYLGFAELLWPHMPLLGERLVAFLSDGAFEEQRGSDWAPRWWRPEDSGSIAPIMILNGRRIEQRSGIEQQGGERWLHRHLRLNGFEPIGLDGRDPASLAWGIIEIEERTRISVEAESDEVVRLGYGVAEAPKGFGFPGAGSNRAHNLPLAGNPAFDEAARRQFNDAARALWVDPEELDAAVAMLNNHDLSQRPRERDNTLANRQIEFPVMDEPKWCAPGVVLSPMVALDAYFVQIVTANPQLRPRIGNPDELRSNRMGQTLDALKHRAPAPEFGVAEAVDGAVITALNEEAVVCAALGNKGGINLVVTYEAFAVKMLGAIRQELIFTRHLHEAGRAPGWLSVPLLLTSHTWENAKNEQSHQDPTLAETLIAEMADTAAVRFPVDANSALAMLRDTYRSHGRIVAMVVPKRELANLLTPDQACRMVDEGLVLFSGEIERAQLILAAVGAYQAQQMLLAAQCLRSRGVETVLYFIGEPARLRHARDAQEARVVLSDEQLSHWFPPAIPRLFLAHTRPESLLGALRRIDTGPSATRALGYINRGGTLDVEGLLFTNRSSWAHVVREAACMLGRPVTEFLSEQAFAAVEGHGDPRHLRQPDATAHEVASSANRLDEATTGSAA